MEVVAKVYSQPFHVGEKTVGEDKLIKRLKRPQCLNILINLVFHSCK